MINIYEKPVGPKTRWVSFENHSAERGVAGLENSGAKGHPMERLEAGECKTLLDVKGSGTINRMWMTLSDRSPEILRSLRLEMYWDGSDTPAVSCPLGDFFGIGLGRRCVFENQFFSDPEGRSFNCFVPMPFRSSAKVTLTNESNTRLSHLFYDINYLVDVKHSPETMYFHTHWRRESPNVLGEDYTILPKVQGQGRFLGTNIGVIQNREYGPFWWGEGEVKVYFGDDDGATLCGTGTEDYIGTAWGQGSYSHRTQGCPIADHDTQQYAFYRYHVDDPVYFDDACRVTIHAIGCALKKDVIDLLDRGIKVIPTAVDPATRTPFIHFLNNEKPMDIRDDSIGDGHCHFYRQDDWSSTAYFYLDAPSSQLPELQSLEERTQGLLGADDDASKRLDV